jgi:3'-phosphoadenosine 5'-phosphosulfate sulfotransferase (PAPS reductase)/FAD synthetase
VGRLWHVVSFSGGKDSTAMLLLMIERKYQIDQIFFCDTGMEFPGMYEHINKVEKYIGRPITRLKAGKSFKYLMFEHIKTKGKNKGKKGYGWPTMWARWCTTTLKQDVIKRHLRQYDIVVEYHGIALDEAQRTKKNQDGRNIRYPLIEWGMTERDCLEYCYNKGFDWGGLYEHFGRVSCWCCPLQSIAELKQLYEHYPELWQRLLDMDRLAWNQYRADYSVAGLDRRFEAESKQLCLF